MKIVSILIIAITSLFITSCEEVIIVDLETAPPQLVIDASIDWVKNSAGNEQRIKLSTTTAYYNDEFPSVSGALISVTNEANSVFTFTESATSKGEYLCTDFEPIIGQTYTLTVNVNNELFTATETLVSVPEISDKVDQDNTGGMVGDEVEIIYYYQDNATQNNYYLYGFETSHIPFTQYAVEIDENTQGNLTPAFYANKDLKPGDVVTLNLYGTSKRYSEYFKKLILASGSGGSPFATTPSAVRGNIINQTNSNNFAYGYFRLCEVAVKEYTVQ